MKKEDRNMKRIIALVAVCCLLFAAVPALSWEDSPKPFIYRGVIPFGMTPDEVKEKAKGLLSAPSSSFTAGDFQFLSFADLSTTATTFCFGGTEDTAGLIEIFCYIYHVVGLASGAESNAIGDYDPAVVQQDYALLEKALTEKYGEPEPASETLSPSFKAYDPNDNEGLQVTLENILHRVLPQADGGRVVVEHSLITEVSTGMSVNMVGYYDLDQMAYLDYLCQQYEQYRQYEDDIHSYLTEML